MHKDGGIPNCDAVPAGPTVFPNRLATEVGAEVGDNVGFVVGDAVGAGVGVVVGTGVGAAVGAVGAGVGLWVTIPQIALIGVASVCVYCSGAVHAAIAAHTVLDVVVAGSSMNSCSVHRVVVLHTLSEVADGVML